MKIIKVLAIDYGEKRVGLAIGDSENKIAMPLKTIKNNGYENTCKEIVDLVKEWEVNRIVIGLPEIHPDQKINKKISHFSKILKKNANVNIIFYNEDYSSNYAQTELTSQMKVGRKKSINKEEIDRIAAAIILQSYFENEIFKRANKRTIKKNIEKLFKVNVIKVNIINQKSKLKIKQGKKSIKSGYKKAIITLKKGQSIDLTTGI